MLELVRGDGKILSCPYPRIDHATKSFIVELLHQSGKPAGLIIDHLHDTGCKRIGTAREPAANFPAGHIFQKTHTASSLRKPRRREHYAPGAEGPRQLLLLGDNHVLDLGVC